MLRAPVAAASARLRCSTASAKTTQQPCACNRAPPIVTATVPHQRTSSARGIDTAPDQQKSASRRRLNASPPARCARGKRSRRAHAHNPRRAYASACRRVRASASRSARAAAHASPPAQGLPGSSMNTPEAINVTVATAEPAHVVFGTAARGAATHVMRRRCARIGSLDPSRCGCAHRQRESSPRIACFPDWTRCESHSASVSTHRCEAALMACSPRSPRLHAT